MGPCARDIGIPSSTLEYWYNAEMAKKGQKRPRGTKVLPVPLGDPSAETPEDKIARLERENDALRKENDSLEMDCAILQSAAAFLVKQRK